jgi:outer membrane lipoprotein-sorting protein
MLVLAVACASLVIPSGATAVSAAQVVRVAPALDAFRGAWAGVKAYSATITVFEQKGIEVQNVVFKFTFRKPSTITVDVVGGTNNGATLLWTGGSTVTARKGGLIGIFKRTLSLHDPQIVTIRGSSIDQLSFFDILAHAQQTAGSISQTPGLRINGFATDAVTLVPATPASDAGYTREQIEISRATHFPLRVLGYVGATLVRKIDFVDVKLSY